MLISSAQILEVLRRQNAWWQTGKVPAELTPSFRRSAYYEIQGFLGIAGLQRAIILSGARRVGKTFILHQIAEEEIRKGLAPRRVLYVSFEDLTLTQANLREILDLYEKNIDPIGEGTLILLDEIHYTTDWTRWLMTILREYPKARIVATGSASTLIRDSSRNESAAGRWVTVHVPTLSFYEYVSLANIATPSLPADLTLDALFVSDARVQQSVLSACGALEREFNRYLLQGGFPEPVAKNFPLATAHRLLREDVIDKALKRDMAQLYGARSLGELDQLFVYLCFNFGGIVERRTLSKEMGVAAATVENHLQRLEDAHLIYRLEPFSLTGKKSLKPRPKVYVADPSLRNAALLRGEGLFSNEEELSAVIEGCVFKHLHGYYISNSPRFTYWRDTQEKEVDFVLIFPDGSRLAWEVKYRETPALKMRDALVGLVQGPSAPRRAWVVTKNTTDYGAAYEGRIFQIPAFLLCYLFGHEERTRLMREYPLGHGKVPYGDSSLPLPKDAIKELPSIEK
jgi:predicted AAA+ superfamily ATPase